MTTTLAPIQPAPEVVAAPPRHRVRRATLPLGAAVVFWGFLSTALVALIVFGYLLWVSALPQARAQQQMYEQFREQIAAAEAPLGGSIAPGTPVALIEAPTIGLRQIVVEGTAAGPMMVGPGHRRDTPLPGQAGVSVVYGHSVAFGGPFHNIGWLRPGDTMTVTVGLGQFTYEVTAVRRANDPLPPPVAAGGSRLTLVTAEGDGWRTGWAPDHAVYVDATMQLEPRLGPPGRPTAIAPAEKAMQGDPNALIPLVLWLQLLAVTAVFALWARARWGGRQTWLTGVPVLLLALWGAIESAGQLLPNLL